MRDKTNRGSTTADTAAVTIDGNAPTTARVYSDRTTPPATRAEIVVIGLDDRLVFLSDGAVWPITTLIDCDGEITHDPDEAVSFVAGYADRWVSALVESYQPLVRH